MAELATPSAAAMSTSTPAAKPKPQFVKPEKPDEEQYKKELAKVEKEHEAAREKLNAIKSKLELAQPNNKESPTAKRQQELRSQLAAIRQQQQGHKTSRTATMEKIRKLDDQLKSRINEHKVARGRVNFKSVEDVDREIARLQKQVDTGTMKLVDEKKALAEISNLTKQRKGFAGFDQAQKGIDEVKAQIAELKKTLDDPESRALSEQYTAITKELDEIKAEQDGVYKNLNALRDERTKLQKEQQEKFSAVKEVKDKYYDAKRRYRDYENEAYKARKERQRAERDAYEAGKRRDIAKQKLEEASTPAYGDEIATAEGLIRYFDPSSAPAKAEISPSKFAASAQRTVDDSGIKGTRVVKKDEDEYFVGGGGKKKKGKKGNAGASPSASSAGKMNLDFGLLQQLAKMNVNPPTSQADVPAVVEKLKEKLEHWKKDQDRKTKENVDKAQKEIDALEAEAAASNQATGTKDIAKKPAQKNAGINGHADAEAELAQEKDAAADAAEELKKASLGDKDQVDSGAEAAE